MTALSPADEMHAAADAMRVEADRLDQMAEDASAGPWTTDALHASDDGDMPILTSVSARPFLCESPDDGVRGGHYLPDADLIVHRRNTIVRDAATLRATAAWLLEEAQNLAYWESLRGDTRELTNATALAVARAFTGKETDRG